MESAHRQAWRCYAGRLPRRWARFGYARKCPNLAAERCGASLGGSYMSPKGWEEWDEAFHRFDGWLRSAMSRIVLRRRHCGPCCEEGSNAKAMPGHFICWHGLVWGRLPRPCVTSFAVSVLRRLHGCFSSSRIPYRHQVKIPVFIIQGHHHPFWAIRAWVMR